MKLELVSIEHLPEIRPGMNLGECLRDTLRASGQELQAGLNLEAHDVDVDSGARPSEPLEYLDAAVG